MGRQLDGVARPARLLFLACAVLYFAGFYGIEKYRHQRGPWEITFATTNDVLTLTINQPAKSDTSESVINDYSKTLCFCRSNLRRDQWFRAESSHPPHCEMADVAPSVTKRDH